MYSHVFTEELVEYTLQDGAPGAPVRELSWFIAQ